MPADPAIGLRIKRARERRRWTQKQLAQAVGVNPKTIDNYENGRTAPRNRTGALEEVLGISLSGEPAAPGPLDDLLPAREEWEQLVFDHPDLPDEIKRRFIEDWRRARADAKARRQRRQSGEQERHGAA